MNLVILVQVYLQCIQAPLCCDPDTLEIREAGGKFLRYWTGAQEILALTDAEILVNGGGENTGDGGGGCTKKGVIASGVVITQCGEVVRMEYDRINNSIIIKK